MILKAVLIALSLCADCFAVSLCSGVTLKGVRFREVITVCLSFAFIQSFLLLAGWCAGDALASVITRVGPVIGALLLLYVGVTMLVEGIRGKAEVHDLNGFRNILIGGVATSIDAAAVGVSSSLAGQDWTDFLPLLLSVFVITAISVAAGILGGKAIGCRFGRFAEIAGGCVLIGIAALLFV